MNQQTTVLTPVTLSGIGLHSGSTVNMRILPAAADTGIMFRRLDVEPMRAMVAAKYDAVCDTRLGTTICNAQGVTVSTIEHLMAALWGAGLDNVLIELDAPEVPIMDGSSQPFVELLRTAGIATLAAPKKILRVLKTVEVREGESTARIAPNSEGEQGMLINITVEYSNKVIGRQQAVYDFRETTFDAALAEARTFGFVYEVEAMQNAGLALGGSLENAIVVGEDAILNEEGLRSADEFVRHKALDCVGDLFLAGISLDAELTFTRPGHHINNKLLRALLADSSAYEIVDSAAQPAPVYHYAAVEARTA